MNIGAVIERVQKVGDLLEKLIEQSNELRDRVIRLEENAEDTTDRVAVLDAKLDRQTALLESVAEDAGVDPETVYAEAGLDGPVEAIAGVADETGGETTEDDDGGAGDDGAVSDASDGGDTGDASDGGDTGDERETSESDASGASDGESETA
jgi:hypothetical protein